MGPRLAAISIGLVLFAAASTGPPATIDAQQAALPEMGVANWPEVEASWGPGRLIGRSGPECGAIRSVHRLADDRRLELSWRRGVVCARRIGSDPGGASDAVRRAALEGTDHPSAGA